MNCAQMGLQMECAWIHPDWIERRKKLTTAFLLNGSISWMILLISEIPGVEQKLNLDNTDLCGSVNLIFERLTIKICIL